MKKNIMLNNMLHAAMNYWIAFILRQLFEKRVASIIFVAAIIACPRDLSYILQH